MDGISGDHPAARKARGVPRSLLRGPGAGGAQGADSNLVNVVDLGRPAALVVYLSDFIVVDGAGPLIAQAAAVDASPHARRGIARRYIDSGRLDEAARFGHALNALVRDARARQFRAVLVESIARLAPDLTSALQAAMLIMAGGIDIYEAATGRVVVEPAIATRIRSGLL